MHPNPNAPALANSKVTRLAIVDSNKDGCLEKLSKKNHSLRLLTRDGWTIERQGTSFTVLRMINPHGETVVLGLGQNDAEAFANLSARTRNFSNLRSP